MVRTGTGAPRKLEVSAKEHFEGTNQANARVLPRVMEMITPPLRDQPKQATKRRKG